MQNNYNNNNQYNQNYNGYNNSYQNYGNYNPFPQNYGYSQRQYVPQKQKQTKPKLFSVLHIITIISCLLFILNFFKIHLAVNISVTVLLGIMAIFENFNYAKNRKPVVFHEVLRYLSGLLFIISFMLIFL